MPILAKAGAASYTPAPAGTHAAVCCDVIDLGVLKVAFGGKEKQQHKVTIVWQIDEVRDDGKPFTVRKRYTCSLHEKASLRKDLESWRGRAFTETELAGFDLENLLSIPALLNVIHAPGRDGGTFANVASLMKLPKGIMAPEVREYVRVCNRPDEVGGQAAPADDSAPWSITDDDVPF